MKKFLSLFLCAVIVLSLCSCKFTKTSDFVLCDVESPVNIHTKAQQLYIDCDNPEDVVKYASSEDDTQPNFLTLSWKWNGKEKPKVFVCRVSETKDFENCITERSPRKTARISNLKLNTKYYWKVTADFDSKEKENIESKIKEFTTSDGSFRFLYCDGVTNMRDLGGHKTVDGKTVKQGLIYRCSKLNDNESEKHLATDIGLSAMRELGIRFELDLRAEKEAYIKRSLIEDTRYCRESILGSYLDGNYYEKNNATLYSIFNHLSDESNFPMIIHCSVGTDRTGFVCYTIGGLLGVPKEELFKDYLFSNFSKDFKPTSRTLEFIENDYVAGYDKEPGETLSEKIEHHLISCGITKEQIDNFKNMMLE